MSNFRIFILAFLVVVLVVLGMIYVNISSRMDVICLLYTSFQGVRLHVQFGAVHGEQFGILLDQGVFGFRKKADELVFIQLGEEQRPTPIFPSYFDSQ